MTRREGPVRPVTFLVRPTGGPYTPADVEQTIGTDLTVHRLDGTSTPARVLSGYLTRDGLAALTLAVPDGI